MAFTSQHLDAVETALARGERVVQYDGRRVEYRSVSELTELRDTIRRELSAQRGHGVGRTLRIYHGGKGV